MFQIIKKYNNQIALDDENYGPLSFKNLIDYSNEIQKKILKKNICLLICNNNIESIVGYIAFLNKRNIITILVDHSFKTEFVNKVIKIYKPKYIFAPKNFNSNTPLALNRLFKSYALYETKFKIKKKINFINFLLLPTSGTTQSPKFVRLSRNNLLDNTKNIIKSLKIKSNHTTITTMPMGYSYGLSIINTHLFAGAKILLNTKTIFEKDFWNKIKIKKPTSFGGVPEFYEYLKKLKFENYDLPSLKYLTQAGGKLGNDYLNYYGKICRDKKIKFIKMYGQTEASPRITFLPWKDFYSKIDSIGKPFKGSRIYLIDKKGKKILKKNKIGEVVYQGKNVSLGYAKNYRDLSKGDKNKKKLFTGDLAKKDKDNFYYIVGRKKRIVKLFGVRLDMDDIEKHLRKHKINCKCFHYDKKLHLKLKNLKMAEKTKNIISSHLGINKNYIIIQSSNVNSFKEIAN
tara:strand:+ start:25213 stop:26586 length:1374 start_codon:yes stop_codon:yes gene_type:complete